MARIRFMRTGTIAVLLMTSAVRGADLHLHAKDAALAGRGRALRKMLE